MNRGATINHGLVISDHAVTPRLVRSALHLRVDVVTAGSKAAIDRYLDATASQPNVVVITVSRRHRNAIVKTTRSIHLSLKSSAVPLLAIVPRDLAAAADDLLAAGCRAVIGRPVAREA